MSNVKNNILLVGQIYLDTILHVPKFPEEDSKLRATHSEQRTGGNTCNSAKVLGQFDNVNVCYMSAVGSRETSSHIIDSLKNVNTDDIVLYRDNMVTPSSIIIHSEQSGSRTIISNNDIQDISLDEFKSIFKNINQNSINQWWVHFEGRNITETIHQIDWLHNEATQNKWRQNLVISVEVEKPEREGIELLLERGDVVFFSKIFAQYYQFEDAASFLLNSSLLSKLKSKAIAFCTWGSKGACALINETKEICQSSPPKIDKVVDTVGAGDTFNAGVILYLSKFPSDIKSAIQFACNLATRKVAQQGFDNLKIPIE